MSNLPTESIESSYFIAFLRDTCGLIISDSDMQLYIKYIMFHSPISADELVSRLKYNSVLEES